MYLREEDPGAEQAEHRSAEEAEQEAGFRQELGNRRHAEGGQRAEGPVRRGHAQSRENTAQPSKGEGAPDAQQAHGPDRRGYGQADEQAFKKEQGHGKGYPNSLPGDIVCFVGVDA